MRIEPATQSQACFSFLKASIPLYVRYMLEHALAIFVFQTCADSLVCLSGIHHSVFVHLSPLSGNNNTPPNPTYHDGCVSNRVLWYDHAVAVFLPLRRLILHVGDGDSQLHRAALVPTVCSHDLPGDIGPLWRNSHTDEEQRKEDKVLTLSSGATQS